MAKKTKSNAVSAVASHPYVQHALSDNGLQDAVREAFTAGEAETAAPGKQSKRGRGIFSKLLLLVIAAGVAIAVNEDLRSKVLDLLFGPEEEFQYTPSSANGAQ